MRGGAGGDGPGGTSAKCFFGTRVVSTPAFSEFVFVDAPPGFPGYAGGQWGTCLFPTFFLCLRPGFLREVGVGRVMDTLRQFTPLPLRSKFSGTNLRVKLASTRTAKTLLYLSIARTVLSRTVTVKCGLIVSRRPLVFGNCGSVAKGSCIRHYVLGTVGGSVIVCSTRAGLSGTPKKIGFGVTRGVKLGGMHMLSPGRGDLIGLIAFIPFTRTSRMHGTLFSTKYKCVNGCSSYDCGLRKRKAFHTRGKDDPFYKGVKRFRRRERVEVRAVLPMCGGKRTVHTLLATRPCRRPMFSVCPLRGS